ncbi:hypothetical protein CRG98_022590 [Punica granatum]|uniref:Uncharacterized protein n=1 Tax=Punica granatum TaxID=22663 RepID=A0A2I0JNJ1_PUNGR|nr:hypothetical protein CRG98_022590 [Punica granatum]
MVRLPEARIFEGLGPLATNPFQTTPKPPSPSLCLSSKLFVAFFNSLKLNSLRVPVRLFRAPSMFWSLAATRLRCMATPHHPTPSITKAAGTLMPSAGIIPSLLSLHLCAPEFHLVGARMRAPMQCGLGVSAFPGTRDGRT